MLVPPLGSIIQQLFFLKELYIQSNHSNIPLCKTERKLTINITTQYNSITSHQKYLLVKKISDKKNRFGTEVIKLVNNAYCTFSSHDFNDDC